MGVGANAFDESACWCSAVLRSHRLLCETHQEGRRQRIICWYVQCCSMRCCNVLYCTVLCCTVLYCTVLYHAIRAPCNIESKYDCACQSVEMYVHWHSLHFTSSHQLCVMADIFITVQGHLLIEISSHSWTRYVSFSLTLPLPLPFSSYFSFRIYSNLGAFRTNNMSPTCHLRANQTNLWCYRQWRVNGFYWLVLNNGKERRGERERKRWKDTTDSIMLCYASPSHHNTVMNF